MVTFCAACEHRHARCMRRCEREADGALLWDVIQDDLMRNRPGADMTHLHWDRQTADVRHAFIAGAQAMRERAR